MISNIDFDEYKLIDAINASGLKMLAVSPAHYKASLEESNKKVSKDLRLGTIIHDFILEPEKARKKYFTLPKIPNDILESAKNHKLTKVYKAWYAEQLSENVGKELLTEEDDAVVKGILASIAGNSTANSLIKNLDATEATVQWQDARGFDCKARFDGYSSELKTIFDLKSARSAEKSEFSKSIFNFGYYIQAAFYFRAAAAAELDMQHFVFLAVEKEPPYAVAVYRLDTEAVELGKKHVNNLLNVYDYCLSTNRWPSFADKIQDIGMPSWAYYRN